MRRFVPVFAFLALLAPVGGRATAAPVAPYHVPIQGVARDADDALIPSGNVRVRVFADSLGGAPLYDSGTEFNGEITRGIFDVVAGRTTPLLLDSELSYFLELDVAGVEVIGDAAGGRLRFRPGGGNHGRTDLEARIDSLEAAMGLPGQPALVAARTRPAAARPASASVTTSFSSTHALPGLGVVAGTAAGFSITGNLLTTPVGRRSAGGVQVELGPYYLFAPHPNPAIRFVHDVPGDQGRNVRVKWRNDLRERPFNPADTQPRITSYTVYRKIGPGQAAVTARQAKVAAVEALPPGEWDVLGSFPATLDTSYQTVVPTLCDSNVAGLCYSVYLVRSITDQPGTFHPSPVDSGYSVDNLAPGVPQGLVAQVVVGGTSLSWQASTAPDFQYFRVYRGPDPGFVPAPGNLVDATETTSFTDPAHGSFTFKVTAVDFNGNESTPAIVSVTVGVNDRVPNALAFASVSPNPFDHTLAMVVEVPQACGRIELALFDIGGRRVRTLVDGALAAGRHTFTWDGRGQAGEKLAPGVYVARLEGAGQRWAKRVTFVK
jgi:hypothetical protein